MAGSHDAGCRDTTPLDVLDAAGIPFGIITNGPVQQNLKIDQLGLRSRTKCIFISEEFGCSKPDPAIFQAAACCAERALRTHSVRGRQPHSRHLRRAGCRHGNRLATSGFSMARHHHGCSAGLYPRLTWGTPHGCNANARHAIRMNSASRFLGSAACAQRGVRASACAAQGNRRQHFGKHLPQEQAGSEGHHPERKP